MSSALSLLILMLLTACGKTKQEQFPVKDENTDPDKLCADPNVSIIFRNSSLISLEKTFITSRIVTCLDLEQNDIHYVHRQSFDNVPNLRYLQLYGNSFHLRDVFANRFENLEVLILDNTFDSDKYTRILTIINCYPKLRKLFLRNNGMYQLLVESQDSFPSLTHLYLSENNLHNDNFAWLPKSLEYLDLTSNKLSKLTLKNLNNLKRIFIDKSYEKSLHSIYFENVGNLEYLSASSNKINKISPQTFANVSSLLYLDLSDNHIGYIEGGSFDSMNKLWFLNLSSNAMKIIQGSVFENLCGLRVLILENNSITMFPMIGKSSELESLSLNHNKIKTIVGGTFAKMSRLETLLLHDNEITSIDQEAFNGLENLRVLTLSNNKLSMLPQHWMEPLLSLQELDLAGNQFLNFENLALSKSSKLQNIYLSNQVLSIRTACLIDLPLNATINLDSSFNFVQKFNIPKYYG